MNKARGRIVSSCWSSIVFLILVLISFSPASFAQQTVGGIRGTVSDQTGALVPDTVVTVVGIDTKLTRTNKSNGDGEYEIPNLPIGAYALTFTHEGFITDTVPSILVQANRTATVNVSLKIGQVSTTVTVEEKSPLMNAVDTTNGYVLEKSQIQSIPLPTGSFTGLAILSPGVNAELPSGSGANAGLGNQPIWANGQRDTSNSFLLNGVDASNLFNGKSTSQVGSARVVNNTGVSLVSSTGIGVIQTTASPYLAIGQALPTPAPETIEEVRVNTSMYDAQQGSTSGAHIDMSTASGTNRAHGSVYIHHGTDWLNAAPYFFNADPTVPQDQKVPTLHREVLGGTFGGALIKDKLFGYVAYQNLHDGDGDRRRCTPTGLRWPRCRLCGAALHRSVRLVEVPHWAKLVAFVSGTLLLPWEVLELIRGITLLRSVLLIGNLAVVFYMLYIIIANRRERRNAGNCFPLEFCRAGIRVFRLWRFAAFLFHNRHLS